MGENKTDIEKDKSSPSLQFSFQRNFALLKKCGQEANQFEA